ncbi:Rieske (2Fe-2S) protein [Marinobacter zhanjiangensis]|uniref:Rieske domain-containing protein n=1 Tax=Marinobacter zhanjiangensis TaxID=578215 RepID=A0ABQ3BAL0_9GAMM|nr:Rieske (2Fe-2S) protein [Marinobacter zhanjiangensis]GGY83381.1 hypothetical protein GCM10007071_33360 [Marinobacter zhanjiangensis]
MSDKRPDSNWVAVCREADIANEQFREFHLGEQPCFVFRRQGQLHAYRNQCPHLGITLNWMPERFMDLDNCFIHCANHGALFVPESGDCIAGPCEGDRLMAVALRVVDGSIEARL